MTALSDFSIDSRPFEFGSCPQTAIGTSRESFAGMTTMNTISVEMAEGKFVIRSADDAVVAHTEDTEEAIELVTNSGAAAVRVIHRDGSVDQISIPGNADQIGDALYLIADEI